MEEYNQKFFRIAYMENDGIVFAHMHSSIKLADFYPNLTEGMYVTVSDEDFNKLEQEFLSAYDLDEENKLVLNLKKAKELHKQKLRRERQPKLEKLDVEFTISLEEGDDIKRKEVVQKKKQLRDITKLVDEATSLEEIRQIGLTNYSGILCTVEDLRSAGLCANGTKEWVETLGWDFKDVIKNGKMSDELLALNDPLATGVVKVAYKRINKE